MLLALECDETKKQKKRKQPSRPRIRDVSLASGKPSDEAFNLSISRRQSSLGPRESPVYGPGGNPFLPWCWWIQERVLDQWKALKVPLKRMHHGEVELCVAG
jgi:hypothetical protein